jgi:hypothetical protein
MSPQSTPHPIDAQPFVETCFETQRVCSEAASHCAMLWTDRSDAREVQLLQKCARICRTSAASFVVGSSLLTQIAAACAKLCEECAQVCDRFAKDRDMAVCAQLCRACARACLEVISARSTVDEMVQVSA